jgi:toxin ParE1/3/4
MGTPRAFDVILTPTAEQDLASLHARIAAESPRAADRFVLELADRIDSLAKFPARGPKARERQTRGLRVRQLIHQGYRVLFTVLGSTVYVLRVGHGARKSLPPNP